MEGNSRYSEVSPDESQALCAEVAEPRAIWGLPWVVRHRIADDTPPQYCQRLLEAHEYGNCPAVLGPLGGTRHRCGRAERKAPQGCDVHAQPDPVIRISHVGRHIPTVQAPPRSGVEVAWADHQPRNLAGVPGMDRFRRGHDPSERNRHESPQLFPNEHDPLWLLSVALNRVRPRGGSSEVEKGYGLLPKSRAGAGFPGLP